MVRVKQTNTAKLCLHLLKLCLEYCRLFFSGHGVLTTVTAVGLQFIQVLHQYYDVTVNCPQAV